MTKRAEELAAHYFEGTYGLTEADCLDIGKQAIDQAITETIERCAKVADTWRANQCHLMVEMDGLKDKVVCEHSAITAEHLAQAIRNLNKEK